MKPNAILVPIDSTEQSVTALTQSYNLARLTNSRIVLLGIADNNNKSELQRKLNELADQSQKTAGIEIEVMVTETKEGYEEINRVADLIGALFVVIGMESKMAFGNIKAAHAFRMVRESVHPVITIRGNKHRDGCKTILLPIDPSFQSRQKVGKGLELAKLFGATLKVVAVHTSTDESIENKLLAYANQSWKYIKSQGVEATIKSVRGTDMPTLILGAAKDADADLIVIMSEDKSGIMEMIKGTAAERIINNSDIPVLSLRPRKMTKENASFWS